MSPTELADRWIALLENPITGTEILHPQIVVRYYPMGKGGAPRVLTGIDAVLGWMRKPDTGKFRYRAGALEAAEAVPGLPPSDVVWRGRYHVHYPAGDFQNQGDWTFHLAGDQVIGVLHEPDALSASRP